MPDMLYVGLQDEDKIAVFAVDRDTGGLTRRADVAAAGGPSVTAISPNRGTLYVGCREQPSIASYRIDPATGGLSLSGTTAQTDAPTFLAPDRTGRHGPLGDTLLRVGGDEHQRQNDPRIVEMPLDVQPVQPRHLHVHHDARERLS